MKKYNFIYLGLSIFSSSILILLILLKVFDVVLAGTSFFLLVFLFALVSLVFAIIGTVILNIYLKDLHWKYNRLREQLETNSGEEIQVDGLEEISSLINKLINEYKRLNQEYEEVKAREYKMNDLITELYKGNIEAKLEDDLPLLKKLFYKYRKLFSLLFQALLKTSLYFHKNRQDIYKLKEEYKKFKEIFSNLSQYVNFTSDVFTKLSGDIVIFVQNAISSLDSLKTLDNVASYIYSSGVKLNEISSKIKQNSDDMFKEISNVDNISKRISEISEQTLLLSMNAIIESSKAGEYGKGFSVIAEEIRKLSESVSKFSKLITSEMQLLKGKINTNKIFSEDILTEAEVLSKNSQKISEISSSSQKIFLAIIDSTEFLSKSMNELSYKFNEILEINNKLISTYNFIDSQVLVPINEKIFSLSEIIETFVGFIDKELKFNSEKVKVMVAFIYHILLINKIFGFIYNIVTVYPEELLDPHECGLGKWYYSVRAEELKNLTEFKNLEKVHIKLHDVIKEVVENKDKLPPQELEGLSGLIRDLSESIVLILNKIIDVLPAEEYSE